MNWEAIGALAELVGAIGVIASLVYLASQIRQNTHAMRGSAHETSVARNTSYAIAIGSSAQVSEVVARGLRKYESLSNAERTQYTHLMGAMLLGTEATFHQYKRGNLEREIWERSLAIFLGYAAFADFRSYWKKTRSTYTPEFQTVVNTAIDKAEIDPDPPSA